MFTLCGHKTQGAVWRIQTERLASRKVASQSFLLVSHLEFAVAQENVTKQKATVISRHLIAAILSVLQMLCVSSSVDGPWSPRPRPHPGAR